MKIIYLIPVGGYSTELRSDTLWGMLCWGIRYLWGKDELKTFIQNAADARPEFVISSAFPFKQHGTERIPFFPNPFVIAPDNADSETETALEAYRLRKKLKSVKWLSADDFFEVLKGKFTVEHLFERIQEEYRLKKQIEEDQQEFFPSGQTVRRTPPVLEENSLTHNTIDRLQGGTLSIADPDDPENKAGQLFHAEEYFWIDTHNESVSEGSNTGIFFLVQGNVDKIIPVLHLFRHLGLGADRSTGKGVFDFHIEEFYLPQPAPDEADALLNLSLYQPSEEELVQWKASEGCLQYMLERREGYVGGYRERRRKQVRHYFKEGSIFRRPTGFSGQYMGCIRLQEFEGQKKPPHDVWDNGFGFMVNLNWKK